MNSGKIFSASQQKAVAEKILNTKQFDHQIAIYAEHYSLIGTNLKLYPGGDDKTLGPAFFCRCQNCNKLTGFEPKYKLFQSMLTAQILEFKTKLDDADTYLDKLYVWNSKLDGDYIHVFYLTTGELSLSLQPQGREETQVHNHYYYSHFKERILLSNNKEKRIKVLGSDFLSLKHDFLERFTNALRKKNMLKQEITNVEAEMNQSRNYRAIEIFNDLINGKKINFDERPFAFEDFYGIIPANETFLYLEFLENTRTNKLKKNPMAEPIKEEKQKKDQVFVTYAWADEADNDKVHSFTNFLRTKGFHAFNDKMKLQEQTALDFSKMMYQEFFDSPKVIVVLSKEYKKKADAFEGGVGVEYNLILKELEKFPTKYIFVCFDKFNENILPAGFAGRFVLSLTDEGKMNDLFAKLQDVKTLEFSPVASSKPEIVSKRVLAFQFEAVDVTNYEGEKDFDAPVWDVNGVETDLKEILSKGSLPELKGLIQSNSFLFYDTYERKATAMPIFHDLGLNGHTCDFVWLNDSSSGPEWVLLKLLSPSTKVLNEDARINFEITLAVEEIKSWEEYFTDNPNEVKKIFGAATKFKFILVVGSAQDWKEGEASRWRIKNEQESGVLIRSINSFEKSVDALKSHPDALYRFNNYPTTSNSDQIEKFWKNYPYMDKWRML
ncbi:SEFIR domain-containing protein [Pedobacter alluvionis]|uniref:SEFIR domain-containing protein n=1 Tax=Pedobacter alluvionis TaxID=475253 RepID=A0A497XV78_9SPHI|nr:SEFIR domain-containing protein [Pedobacter alluvionis]RLJ73643.1 SEFIR domain-containing protein [Pedobacter alluvionis]TFB32731.1 hypothetical protein E3V97_01445 [Pedobacter alluvionis]